MESFDRALRGFSQKRVEVEHAHLREDVMASVSSGGLLGTNLVLCTVFKNEAAYLEEWLQYHQLLGVSKVRNSLRVLRRCARLSVHAKFLITAVRIKCE